MFLKVMQRDVLKKNRKRQKKINVMKEGIEEGFESKSEELWRGLILTVIATCNMIVLTSREGFVVLLGLTPRLFFVLCLVYAIIS